MISEGGFEYSATSQPAEPLCGLPRLPDVMSALGQEPIPKRGDL